MGANLAPEDVEPAMAAVVARVEAAGAARGKAVLLLNPADVTPRVSVLALVSQSDTSAGSASDLGAEHTDDIFDAAVGAALDGSGFVLLQPIQPQAVDAATVRTLVSGDPVTATLAPDGTEQLQRVDVLLEAEEPR